MTIGLMFACGSESNQNSNQQETNQNKIAETEETKAVLSEDNANDSSSADKKQIDYYCEYFLKDDVFLDRNKINWDAGDMYYYELLDLEGGYASVAGAFEGGYVFVLWRMANGNDLVGKTSSSCGPVCDYTLNLYEVSATAEKEVTQTILPIKEIDAHAKEMESKVRKQYETDPSDAPRIKYDLPRKGTSIDVILSMESNEIEFKILTLSWDKSRFSVAEKIKEVPAGLQN